MGPRPPLGIEDPSRGKAALANGEAIFQLPNTSAAFVADRKALSIAELVKRRLFAAVVKDPTLRPGQHRVADGVLGRLMNLDQTPDLPPALTSEACSRADML